MLSVPFGEQFEQMHTCPKIKSQASVIPEFIIKLYNKITDLKSLNHKAIWAGFEAVPSSTAHLNIFQTASRCNVSL